jgi:CRISPR/Cas system-associated protein Cas7 (RAMP superfamily)
MHNLKVYALYRAKQPIIHTEETIGNISKIKKMRVIHDGKPVPIPALSGNSFRGQFRDILADRMFDILTKGGAHRVRLSPDYYGII